MFRMEGFFMFVICHLCNKICVAFLHWWFHFLVDAQGEAASQLKELQLTAGLSYSLNHHFEAIHRSRLVGKSKHSRPILPSFLQRWQIKVGPLRDILFLIFPIYMKIQSCRSQFPRQQQWSRQQHSCSFLYRTALLDCVSYLSISIVCSHHER